MGFEVFGAHDDFFDRLSLRDIHHVGSALFVSYNADSPMIPSVGHAFVDARVYLHHHLLPRLVLVKDLAEPDFTSVSGFLP